MQLEKPVVLYDGDCPFCCRWVERLSKRTDRKVRYVPYERAEGLRYNIKPEEAKRAVQFVELDGTTYSGAEGIVRILGYAENWGWIKPVYAVWPMGVLMEWGYALVARSRGTHYCDCK